MRIWGLPAQHGLPACQPPRRIPLQSTSTDLLALHKPRRWQPHTLPSKHTAQPSFRTQAAPQCRAAGPRRPAVSRSLAHPLFLQPSRTFPRAKGLPTPHHKESTPSPGPRSHPCSVSGFCLFRVLLLWPGASRQQHLCVRVHRHPSVHAQGGAGVHSPPTAFLPACTAAQRLALPNPSFLPCTAPGHQAGSTSQAIPTQPAWATSLSQGFGLVSLLLQGCGHRAARMLGTGITPQAVLWPLGSLFRHPCPAHPWMDTLGHLCPPQEANTSVLWPGCPKSQLPPTQHSATHGHTRALGNPRPECWHGSPWVTGPVLQDHC